MKNKLAIFLILAMLSPTGLAGCRPEDPVSQIANQRSDLRFIEFFSPM